MASAKDISIGALGIATAAAIGVTALDSAAPTKDGAKDVPADVSDVHTYAVLSTDDEVEKYEAALWDDYAAEQRAARGLAAGECLDVTPTGERVCITVRYAEAKRIEGVPGGLLPVDARVRSMDGQRVQTATKGEVTLDVVEVAAKDVPVEFAELISAKVDEETEIEHAKP